MRCPSCEHENREAARFCGACRAPLQIDLSCRACGADLAPAKARIAAEAAGGEILVSAGLKRRAEGASDLRFGAPRAAHLKGISEAQTLHLV